MQHVLLFELKIVILHLNNNIGDENDHSKSAQRT